KSWVNRLCVAPKIFFAEMIWSPLSKSAEKVENTAAIPEANANPLSAPSILQTLSINSVVFGLEYLEYTLRSFSSAKEARISSASSNPKLEVRYIGVECSKNWVRPVWVRMASV